MSFDEVDLPRGVAKLLIPPYTSLLVDSSTLRILALLVLSAACCRNRDALVEAPALIRLEGNGSFSPVFQGASNASVTLTALNLGEGKISVEWISPSTPFAVEGLPTRLESGATAVRVTLQTANAGRFRDTLKVTSSDGQTALVTLSGLVNSPLFCTPSGPCVDVDFDAETGRCVERPRDNGSACAFASKCLVDSQCQNGRCVGEPVVCTDGNACTVDVCNDQTGCEFLPRPPCPGDGICRKGVCDPTEGCGLTNVEDGASCGQMQTCKAAQVCIAGACVIRDPPDGYICKEASPCEAEARCVADVCMRKPSTALAPAWTYQKQFPADGGVDEVVSNFHDFVQEPSGAMTLGNFFQSPGLLRANTVEAQSAPEGPARRCLLWNGRLVCADYPFPQQANGRISAIDLQSGLTLWTFDIRRSKPEFVAQTSQIFMARLVVQSENRIAAVFEGYPPREANTTECRRYFLVVLDAGGKLVQAQSLSEPLIDPMLAVCNHPHPYGAASDSVGNLFLAFSPSSSTMAPLFPTQPTLLVSYSRDGVFRWKTTDPMMVGGELAIARGLLYSENSPAVLTAATGNTSFVLNRPLGRTVVSDARMIPAPQPNASTLVGYEGGTNIERWTHRLDIGTTFWSDQVRLAQWKTSKGRRTVALTFIQDSIVQGPQSYSLKAIDVRDGSEAFVCPLAVSLQTPPQLVEIANGHLGLMEGAFDENGNEACKKCDPPFARSAATFYDFLLPKIDIANEPWVGTFGGAGHDHKEDIVTAPSGSN